MRYFYANVVLHYERTGPSRETNSPCSFILGVLGVLAAIQINFRRVELEVPESAHGAIEDLGDALAKIIPYFIGSFLLYGVTAYV